MPRGQLAKVAPDSGGVICSGCRRAKNESRKVAVAVNSIEHRLRGGQEKAIEIDTSSGQKSSLSLAHTGSLMAPQPYPRA